MPGSTKSFMESRFGTDFSDVRIHTGDYATQMSGELNAQAFTVGSDIYFNRGKYSPESDHGRHLLAHELTHTIQQGTGVPGTGSINRRKNFIQLKEDIKPIVESKEVDQNGRKIKVERVITPGECTTTKNSSSSLKGDFKDDKILFEAKACKKNVTGEAYGDIDFKEFVDGANNFVKALPGISSGGQLTSEIDKDFKDAKLKGSLKLVLRVNHVRVELEGKGGVSAGGNNDAGVSGFIRYADGKVNIELGGGVDQLLDQVNGKKGSFHLFTDIGPVIIRVNGTVDRSGVAVEGKIFDTDISKNAGIGIQYDPDTKRISFNLVLTIPEKIPKEDAPICAYCHCEKPTIVYRCTEFPPPGKTKPDVEIFQTQYIPLFYNYSTTEPRNGKNFPKDEYQRTINNIMLNIEKGYTIRQIEGYTSPEGSLDKAGKFEGNKDLSKHRAEKARDDIKESIGKQLSKEVLGLLARDLDKVRNNLKTAHDSNMTIVPMDESHGSDDTTADISKPHLFEHLIKELKAPEPGEEDILEKEHVKGASLPEDLRAIADKDIGSFREGGGKEKPLSREHRLQLLYPWLRRALVIMDPPARHLSLKDLQPSPESLKDISGTFIPCTKEHEDLFKNAPLPGDQKLIIDHCSKNSIRT